VWLVRSQSTVEDESYMRAMIPHHSIAILTSSRADLDDVRVRALADRIIEAQKREIEEMNWLLDDIEANGKTTNDAEGAARPVPEFASADYDGSPSGMRGGKAVDSLGVATLVSARAGRRHMPSLATSAAKRSETTLMPGRFERGLNGQ